MQLKLSHLSNRKKKGMKKNEQNLKDLWDTIKYSNLFIMEVSKGEARKNGTRRIYEEMVVENFPYWDINLYIFSLATFKRINSDIHILQSNCRKPKMKTLKSSKREAIYFMQMILKNISSSEGGAKMAA